MDSLTPNDRLKYYELKYEELSEYLKKLEVEIIELRNRLGEDYIQTHEKNEDNNKLDNNNYASNLENEEDSDDSEESSSQNSHDYDDVDDENEIEPQKAQEYIVFVKRSENWSNMEIRDWIKYKLHGEEEPLWHIDESQDKYNKPIWFIHTLNKDIFDDLMKKEDFEQFISSRYKTKLERAQDELKKKDQLRFTKNGYTITDYRNGEIILRKDTQVEKYIWNFKKSRYIPVKYCSKH
ncbi:hypothetical protein QAD02_012557 [Eretmocerus hayati]|uniref:Uncharacterized protein n=2 Tax=Eretmocerus hayati TaxID=131215 RepID=A0ACC2N7X5_9HYME|nr:hypothetical protein QAD02_007422 [Eretmocerus hayati]KAJ8676770.1 hypothetical protein QAD02_012557 [Eretmocerus hayati]